MTEKTKAPPKLPSASGKLNPIKVGKAAHPQGSKPAGPRTPQQEYAAALKRMALEVGRLRKSTALSPAHMTALQDAAAQVKLAATEAQKAKPDAHRLSEMLTKAHAQIRSLKPAVPHADALETRIAHLLEQAPKLF